MDKEQVRLEALKIDQMAKSFVSGQSYEETVQRFHSELVALQSQGKEFTRAVLDQVKKDNSVINFLPEVDIREKGNGALGIDIFPNALLAFLTADNRSMGGLVGRDSVLSDAYTGQHYPGKHILGKYQRYLPEWK